MEDKLPDLNGKVVLIYFIGRTDRDGIVLRDVSFERQCGRLFLCGTVVEGTTVNDWVSGVMSFAAWDRVEEYLIFDSAEDYLARVERGRASTQVQ